MSSEDLKLYALPLSPPSRAVHLAIRLLDLPAKYIEVDVLGGGTRTPEYLAMNPQHTVPVLKDGDYVLSESRAILTYLCEEFSGEKYYPKDSKMRGIIQQRLSFDLGILYRRLGDAVYPVCFGKRENIPEEERKSMHEAMMWMEDFLKTTKYIAGDILTIADISLVGTVSTFEACEKGLGSLDAFPKTKEWLQIMKVELPDYETVCGKGCQEYKAWFESMYKPSSSARPVTMDL